MPEVGIIGAGTMGHGIAQCFAVKGWQVRLYDVNREVLGTAPARIRSNLELFVEVGWAQPEAVEATIRNIALSAGPAFGRSRTRPDHRDSQ